MLYHDEYDPGVKQFSLSLSIYPTKGPMWGYPRPVLGAVDPLLEPFPGHLSPNIDNVSKTMTLRYPHEGPWVDRAARARLVKGHGLRGEGVEVRERTANARQTLGNIVRAWGMPSRVLNQYRGTSLIKNAHSARNPLEP